MRIVLQYTMSSEGKCNTESIKPDLFAGIEWSIDNAESAMWFNSQKTRHIGLTMGSKL